VAAVWRSQFNGALIDSLTPSSVDCETKITEIAGSAKTQMTLHDAIELNRDMVDLLQTNRSGEAIQVYLSRWSTLQLALPRELAVAPNGAAMVVVLAAHGVPEPRHLISTPSDSPNPSRSASPVRGGQHQEEHSDGTVDTNQLSSGTLNSNVPAPFRIRSVPTDDYMVGIPLDEAPENFFTIYNQAFDIDILGPVATTSEWLLMANCITVVLVFNLALAHHILAVKYRSMVMYAMALQYYELAHGYVLQHSWESEYGYEMYILYMGLVNNIGHCNGWLQWPGCALCCFDILHSTLLELAPILVHYLLSREDCIFFLDRMILGIPKLYAPAAAA
jgi:hypothetical protein